MSKKNSNVILKDKFKNYQELSKIYINFKKQLNKLKKNFFLIAVSGGPDSLALAALAKAYSYEKKSKFHYVLVDHKIRKDSSKEANLVKILLKKHNISLNILKNKNSIIKNVQSKAREIRYYLLTDYCKKNKINTILTAHNLEDQVETFFIRLSRGSGLHGLSSMKIKNKINKDINLVRPLLDFKKEQLIKISKVIFGKFFNDPSNKDDKYLRTKVRNLKGPLEKSGINYDQIIKSIKNLASSRDTLDLYLKAIYKKVVNKKKNEILIKFKEFSCFNREIQMRIFMKSIKDLSNSYYSPRSKKILNLVDQIKENKNTKLTLGGCVIFRQKKHIFLRKEEKIKVF